MMRTTPADRYSRRERFGRSRGAGSTSAVPASTATAGSVVTGSSRGSGVTAARSAYCLMNHGRRDMSLASRSCTIRGSSMASSHSRPGWYEVSRCSVCVAVSTLQGKHGILALGGPATDSPAEAMDRKQRISYLPLEAMDDEMRAEMERCRREGTPRPESSAVRAHVPACFWAFTRSWQAIFREGVCDHAIKELCRVYVSRSVKCEYCGNQRSEQARASGLSEGQYDDLLNFETSQLSRSSYCPSDRKSTRLNSSHMSISYAVFCLKKKKENQVLH